MTTTLEQRIADWDGEGVISRYHRDSGAWIFIALHSSVLGTPTGGTRMKSYPSPADGLLDAMRLAAGMTHKWAASGFGYGGGKAVLAVPEGLSPERRRSLLEVYGQLLSTLSGAFATGVDLGTDPEDMVFLRRFSPHVHGVDDAGGAIDPGPFTARGVLAAMRATTAALDGSPELTDRVLHIQGVGGVGTPLARLAASAGARLVLSDIDEARARVLADELGADTAPTEPASSVECDLFAPCAVGGVINEQTVGDLACRAVVGSANNQLAEAADAERVAARGILYCPDYVVNSGGAIAFALINQGERDHAVLEAGVARVGDSLAAILAEAAEVGISPAAAADRIVARALDPGRSSG